MIIVIIKCSFYLQTYRVFQASKEEKVQEYGIALHTEIKENKQ